MTFGMTVIFVCLYSNKLQNLSLCLSRAFVDSRIQPIYGGTNEIMKELIARNIVKK